MDEISFDPCGDIALILDSQSKECSITVRLLVSSKHMMLASPVFRAMLQHGFRERAQLEAAKLLELPLPDDDVFALTILLDIVHGRSRKVPRQVNLEMLMTLSILVDKYELHEVVEIFSDGWIQCLRGDLPTALTEDLLRWLCVSWVFEQREEFLRVTQVAQRESPDKLELEGLPVPEEVIEAIEQSRCDAIQGAIATLANLIELYQGVGPQCKSPATTVYNYSCDAMILGSLIKRSKEINLWPPPTRPFHGLTFSAVQKSIGDVHTPTLCQTLTGSPNPTAMRTPFRRRPSSTQQSAQAAFEFGPFNVGPAASAFNVGPAASTFSFGHRDRGSTLIVPDSWRDSAVDIGCSDLQPLIQEKLKLVEAKLAGLNISEFKV